MCEILLCVKNMGTSGNPSTDSHAPQQGDVIDVHPDGWTWGECELGGPLWTDVSVDPPIQRPISEHRLGNHNFFRIIKLPNVTVAQASRMLPPEIDTDPSKPSPYLQYRAFFLDKTKILPATMQNLIDYWQDDGRSQGFVTLNYTAAQINSIVTQRTPIPF